MLNIIIYINHLKPGGAENQVYRLIKNYKKKNHKFFIVTKYKYSKKSFIKKFLKTNSKIIYLDQKYRGKISQLFYLKSFIKKNNIKVVQSYLCGDNIFCTLLTIGTSLKHISGYRGDYGNPVFKRSILQKLKNYISWYFSDLIVSNNQCGLKYLESLKLINKNKIKYIPNGIHYPSLPKIKNNYKIIGCLSNFWQYKNHTTLIEAYAKIKNDYQLRLAGDGPEFHKCYELLEKNSCIPEEILLGSIYNLDDFFKKIDIFIYPSLREGSPNSLLEAMSYGKFCLVSDIPEHREALGPEVHVNCFFEPQRSDDLIKKILFWDKNKNEMLIQAKNNRNRIMKEYSIKILTNSFNRLYDSF